jgi:hypothetical protein
VTITRIDIGIVIDVAPDVGELRMCFGVDRIVGLGPVEGQPKNALRRILECQSGIGGIAIGHLYPPFLARRIVRGGSWSLLKVFIVVVAGPRTVSSIGEP